MSLPVLMMAVVSVSLNALAQIALKKTMITIGPVPGTVPEVFSFLLSLLSSIWFLAGMSCYVVSIGVWLGVLAKAEVSSAYPLLSIGYVITAVIGYLFLGEGVGFGKMAGIALICCGILVISRNG